MPGLFGAYIIGKNESLTATKNEMAAAMNPNQSLRVDGFIDNTRCLCMGRVSLGVFNAVEQPVRNDKIQSFILFHGELYDNPGPLTDPDFILEKYSADKNQCARDLNGIFHFVIYDERQQTIKLFTDKFGLQPLYYSQTDKGFFFGGEIKAILANQSVDKTPDLHSFSDFFQFGQPLGQKTLFKGIKLLGPGEVLTFHIPENRIVIDKYWNMASIFQEKGATDASVSMDMVVEQLVHSINSRGRNHDKLGISLSGGLDSRGILAGLGEHSKGIRSYTLGLPNCSDQKLAERMSAIAGTRHEFVPLDERYTHDFENMAMQMIELSDGLYHPRESTEILALEYLKRCGFNILLRGHGGEMAKAALAHPVMVNAEVQSCSDSEAILKAIMTMTNIVLRDIDTDRLFQPAFLDIMKTGPSTSLQESCGNVSRHIAPADVCLYYYINEHIRRQVVSSLEIFKTQVETRMPYVDEHYLHLMLKLPLKDRYDGQVHSALVKTCMPALLCVPNSNTGAPLDAGKARLFLTDKFNAVMKRLSIPGFRHYTEYNKWQREGFKDSISRIIFSDRLADRGIYDMNHLRFVFEQHVSGSKNYGAFIGTVVGLELWQRRFAD